MAVIKLMTQFVRVLEKVIDFFFSEVAFSSPVISIFNNVLIISPLKCVIAVPVLQSNVWSCIFIKMLKYSYLSINDKFDFSNLFT